MVARVTRFSINSVDSLLPRHFTEIHVTRVTMSPFLGITDRLIELSIECLGEGYSSETASDTLG